jgi:hypothetical protein
MSNWGLPQITTFQLLFQNIRGIILLGNMLKFITH